MAPAQSRIVVRSLYDASRWPLDFVNQPIIRDNLSNAHRMLKACISTAFSGVCAPSVALTMLSAPISNFQDDAINLEYESAIEILPQSRAELEMLPHEPAHIFGNILSFCTADTLRILEQYKDGISVEHLEHTFLNRDSMTLTAPCFRCGDGTLCGKRCALGRGAWLHVAGILCTDWSTQGRQRGLDGATMIPLFCWLTLRRALLTPILLLENVVSFPYDLIGHYLHMYKFYPVTLSNDNTFGIAVSRDRKYCVGVLQLYYHLERPLTGDAGIAAVLGRTRGSDHTWRDFFVAGDAELRSELAWSIKRSCRTRVDVSTLDISGSAFESSLVGWEAKHLQGFRSRGRGRLYTLSQDPARNQRSTASVAQTLIAGQHMVWNDELDRWATGRECLAMQGFPTVRVMLDAVFGNHRQFRLSSWDAKRARYGLFARSRSAMVHQSGNAMHTAAVGACLLWIFCFIVERPTTSISRSLTATENPHDPCDDAGDAVTVTPLSAPITTFDQMLTALVSRPRHAQVAVVATPARAPSRCSSSLGLDAECPPVGLPVSLVQSLDSCSSVAATMCASSVSPATSSASTPLVSLATGSPGLGPSPTGHRLRLRCKTHFSACTPCTPEINKVPFADRTNLPDAPRDLTTPTPRTACKRVASCCNFLESPSVSSVSAHGVCSRPCSPLYERTLWTRSTVSTAAGSSSGSGSGLSRASSLVASSAFSATHFDEMMSAIQCNPAKRSRCSY